MPPTIEVVSTTVEVDQNQTATTEAPDFPLLSYDENNVTTEVIPVDQPSVMQAIPQIAPPDNLPLSDPFEDINSLGIDSTDQLRSFENSNLRGPRTGFQQIPFVPPYTVAPDNLRVTNRATYKENNDEKINCSHFLVRFSFYRVRSYVLYLLRMNLREQN